ncbi:MAG: Sec-independent protein translocase subunit TatA [Cellulomonas sp.]
MNALKPWHVIVLLVVVLLLFGAKRLPDLAKSVGESLKIFKSELKDLTEDDKPATPATTPVVPPPVVVPPVVAPPVAAPPAAPPSPYEGFDGGTPPRT